METAIAFYQGSFKTGAKRSHLPLSSMFGEWLAVAHMHP